MNIESYSQTESTSFIRESAAYNGPYFEGEVATPLGFVLVYSQPNHSSYRMALDGRFYICSESQTRTRRGLAIMANKFARKVKEVA